MAAFVEKQLHLLEIEHLAEVEEKNFEASNLSTKILQRFVVLVFSTSFVRANKCRNSDTTLPFSLIFPWVVLNRHSL